MKGKWWKEGVVYQIYPRSFNDSNGDGIGDLQGIIQRLDYLRELGVDIIWLSPVYKSPNDDNGYDVSDYYSIMPEFGTMDDMRELILSIHQRDMRLILDLVVNHTSDEHPWFKESRSSPDNPYRDYYIWRKGRGDEPPNNWKSIFGGSVWEYDQRTDEYYLHLFSRRQPDLNWEHPAVREEIYRVARFWLDEGCDGFRLDAVNHISKDPELPDGEVLPGNRYGDGRPYFVNGPRVHEFLQEMHREVFSHYDLMTVGEAAWVTPEVAKLYTAPERRELDMIFQFQLMFIDHEPDNKWVPKEWDLFDIKNFYQDWCQDFTNRGWNSIYMSNHDMPRMVSRFGDDGRYRLPSATMLATLLFTLPGTPFIYQGQEIGMTNLAFDSIEEYRDVETHNYYREQKALGVPESEIMADIHRKSRDNSRTPMQWDGNPGAGFTTGDPWIGINPNYTEINVEADLHNSSSILHYYRSIIRLRKEYPVFVYGNYQPLLEDDPQLFCYLRTGEEERMLVILNYSDREASFEAPDQLKAASAVPLLSNYNHISAEEGQQKRSLNTVIELKPYAAIIFKLDDQQG